MHKHISTVRLLEFTLRKPHWKTVIGAWETRSTVSACEAWWSHSKSNQTTFRWDEELGQRGSPLPLSAITCPSVMKYYHHDEKKIAPLVLVCWYQENTSPKLFRSNDNSSCNHFVFSILCTRKAPVYAYTANQCVRSGVSLHLLSLPRVWNKSWIRPETWFHFPAGRVIINNWCQLVSFGALPRACNGELQHAPRKGGFVYKMIW